MQLKFKNIDKNKFDNKASPRRKGSKKANKVQSRNVYGQVLNSKDLGVQGSGVYSARDEKRTQP